MMKERNRVVEARLPQKYRRERLYTDGLQKGYKAVDTTKLPTE